MVYNPTNMYKSIVDYMSGQGKSIRRKALAGLAAIVTMLAAAGCNKPLVDWHTKSGAPVKGLIPVVLSAGAPGEKHHELRPIDYSQPEYPQGVILAKHPIE
jgi:hypothetical protein